MKSDRPRLGLETSSDRLREMLIRLGERPSRVGHSCNVFEGVVRGMLSFLGYIKTPLYIPAQCCHELSYAVFVERGVPPRSNIDRFQRDRGSIRAFLCHFSECCHKPVFSRFAKREVPSRSNVAGSKKERQAIHGSLIRFGECRMFPFLNLAVLLCCLIIATVKRG
jgi:hypothetical protein